MKLFDYQREGAEWLAARASALLAWQMGTGKTPTATVACDLVKARRVLVLCPAVARPVWRDAFQAWARPTRPVRVLHSSTSTTAAPDSPECLIVSYDLLSRDNGLLARLASMDWDALICDEAHALKNPDSVRTKAVYGKKTDGVGGLVSKSKHVWLLTGTPVLNHAGELWPHLRTLAPDTIEYEPGKPMPYAFFTERYCEFATQGFGKRPVGSRNMADLANRLSRFMSRKRFEDVVKDRPPLVVGTTPVSVHDAKIDKELLAAFNEAQTRANEYAAQVDTADPDEFLAHLRSGALVMASERRLTGLLKAPVVAELVASELQNNDDKLIVFAQHTAVIDKLVHLLAAFGPVVIDGRTSDARREANVQAFQTDPACRVFIGQLQAASTAITLTAARNVFMAEADWTPAMNDQAIRRAYRIGQTQGVTARFIALDGTLDMKIMKILARKTADIAALIDANQPAA